MLGPVQGFAVLRALPGVAVAGLGERVQQAPRRMAAAVEHGIVGQRHLDVGHHQPAVHRTRALQQVVGLAQRLEQDADQVDRVLLVWGEAGGLRVEAKLLHAAEDLGANHVGERPPVFPRQHPRVRRRVLALQQGGDVEHVLGFQHLAGRVGGRIGERGDLVGHAAAFFGGNGVEATVGAPGAQLFAHDVAIAQRLAGFVRGQWTTVNALAAAGAGPGDAILTTSPASGLRGGPALGDGFHHTAVGDPLSTVLRRARLAAAGRSRRLRPVALPVPAVLGFGEGGVGLGIDLAEDLGQALVELLEHHRAQAGGQVVCLEQVHERGHRDLRAQRVARSALDADARRQRFQPLVQLGQRMQELVLEQLDDLLPRQVRFQLALRHQLQVLGPVGLGGRLAPVFERRLDRLAVAGGQLQRAVAERQHRDAVFLGGAEIVAGQRRQPDLLFDRAPESGQHAHELGHGFALEPFKKPFCVPAAGRCRAGAQNVCDVVSGRHSGHNRGKGTGCVPYRTPS